VSPSFFFLYAFSSLVSHTHSSVSQLSTSTGLSDVIGPQIGLRLHSLHKESMIVWPLPAIYQISLPTERPRLSIHNHLLWLCINNMVNWHDPALLVEDYRTSCRLRVSPYHPSQSPIRDSYFHQAEQYCCWYLHVCFIFNDKKACALISRLNDASWEVVITAGFELDVLRGKRPYRWTIWVSASYIVKHHCLKCK
jgi:hypothetical protein